MATRQFVKEADQQAADEFKRLVLARTGLTPDKLQCPREKSDMTPCLARDGHLAVTYTTWNRPICVGCEAHLHELLKVEQDKAK